MDIKYNKLQQLAVRLQYHASLFRTFWDWSSIEFSDQISTACVSFDKLSGTPIQILLNEQFWNSLDEESQAFVIAHELMHILLNHGARYKADKYNLTKVNIAEDIVIDHMLEDYLYFNRAILNPFLRNDISWIDTVFPNRIDVLSNQSTDYYYNLLPDNLTTEFDTVELSAEDIEDFLESTGIRDMAESDSTFSQVLSEEAGTGKGAAIQLQKKHIKPKKKWESVVKEWESRHIRFITKKVERWDRVNRRFQDILATMMNCKLPTNIEIADDYIDKSKLDVFFFLDSSGSCYDLKDRFYAAAKSLDPKRFRLRTFAFDTSVVELDLSSGKFYGGGGTRFDIIENKIQSIMRNENIRKYPHVWCISDGYGNSVTPQKPERWNWFLTKGHTKRYIHEKSRVFNLEDYE